MTPNFLVGNSKPTYAFLPSSIWVLRLSESLADSTYFIALCIFLAEIRIDAKTSSLTAFEFAPGALKTGIACSVYFSIGMLLTPEPALPTA